MAKSKFAKRYPPEFHRQMVELVRAGRKISELSREFGCSQWTIHRWVRQADRDEGRGDGGGAAGASDLHRVPVLLAALLTIKLFGPRLLEPVFVSLFVQGIALALLWADYSYRVDKVDFDVYRPDAQDSTPGASARINSP